MNVNSASQPQENWSNMKISGQVPTQQVSPLQQVPPLQKGVPMPGAAVAPMSPLTGAAVAPMGPFTGAAAAPAPVPRQQTVAGPAAAGSSGTPYIPQPMPVTPESMQFLHGILTTQIGRKVTVDFLIGSNTLTDRTGTLLAVGINYIVLREVETDDLLVCDFYTIKFVTIYY